MKIKLILSILSIAASMVAAPYDVYNFSGQAQNCGSTNTQYEARYFSDLGGVWNVRGVHHTNSDGSFSDTINATVSNTTLTGSYTQDDFPWFVDSIRICNGTWLVATTFLLVFDNGSVHGFATYY